MGSGVSARGGWLTWTWSGGGVRVTTSPVHVGTVSNKVKTASEAQAVCGMSGLRLNGVCYSGAQVPDMLCTHDPCSHGDAGSNGS